MAPKKGRTKTAEQKAIEIARRFSIWLRDGGNLDLSSDAVSRSDTKTSKKKRSRRAA
jgi:hypothetical protein